MKDYLGYEAIQTGAPQILVVLLFVLSFLGISNTILLAILERTKETGMMRALGMTDNQMILIYMMEAGFLGFTGSVLGIILGCIVNYPMVKYGFDFSAMADMMSQGIGFRVTSNFRSMWNVPLIIASGMAATLLSSFMAACTGIGANFPIRMGDLYGNTFSEMPLSNSIFFRFSFGSLVKAWVMGVAVASFFTLIPSLKSAFVAPERGTHRPIPGELKNTPI